MKKSELRQIIREELSVLMERKKPGLSPAARNKVVDMMKKHLNADNVKVKPEDRVGHIFTAKGSKNGLYVGEGIEDGDPFFNIYTIDHRGYPANKFWEKGKFTNLDDEDVKDENMALKIIDDLIKTHKKFLSS